MKRALIIKDLHLPYNDKAFTECLFQAMKIVKPDFIWLEELMDMYPLKAWTKTSKEDVLEDDLEFEIAAGNKFLDRVQKTAKDADIEYLYGNHCDRYDRYMYANARPVYKRITLAKELRLRERGIKQHDHGTGKLHKLLGTDLGLCHTPFTYGKNVAMGNLNEKHVDMMSGCTHRTQYVATRDGDDRLKRSYAIGCGIDLKSPAFAYKPYRNWSHSFAIVNVWGKKDKYSVNIVEVIDGVCVIDGKLVDGNKFLK